MVAIARSVGESIRVGDVFFEVVKIEKDKVILEVLASDPIYIPYRPSQRPVYLGHPEVHIEHLKTL